MKTPIKKILFIVSTLISSAYAKKLDYIFIDNAVNHPAANIVAPLVNYNTSIVPFDSRSQDGNIVISSIDIADDETSLSIISNENFYDVSMFWSPVGFAQVRNGMIVSTIGNTAPTFSLPILYWNVSPRQFDASAYVTFSLHGKIVGEYLYKAFYGSHKINYTSSTPPTLNNGETNQCVTIFESGGNSYPDCNFVDGIDVITATVDYPSSKESITINEN